jgi:hypothetical protein
MKLNVLLSMLGMASQLKMPSRHMEPFRPRRIRRSKYVQHQGKGEIARREARIARGLVSPVYSAADVHKRVA